MLLVTGTGRCGTAYLARYLQACGLDVGHEVLRRDGIVGWDLAVGRTCVSRCRPIPDFDLIIHVVRDPRATIASWQTCRRSSWDFVCANSPTQRDAEPVRRGMQHWFWWNVLAEAVADLTIRIEDFDHADLCRTLGIESPPPDIPTHVNSRRHRDLSAVELESADGPLWSRIQTQARRYGYPF